MTAWAKLRAHLPTQMFCDKHKKYCKEFLRKFLFKDKWKIIKSSVSWSIMWTILIWQKRYVWILPSIAKKHLASSWPTTVRWEFKANEKTTFHREPDLSRTFLIHPANSSRSEVNYKFSRTFLICCENSCQIEVNSNCQKLSIFVAQIQAKFQRESDFSRTVLICCANSS